VNGRRLALRVALTACVALLAIALAAQAAGAATITVDTEADTLTGSQCSLRAAIEAANRDAPVAGCSAGSSADRIVLPTGHYALAIPSQYPDDESTGDLDLTSPVTIEGAGATTTVIDGAGIDRVFSVVNGATVTISGVTITGGQAFSAADQDEGFGQTYYRPDISGNPGSAGGSGGGILDEGVLTLVDDVVTGNRAGNGGGEGKSPNGEIANEYPGAHDNRVVCEGGYSIGGAGGTGGSGGGIDVHDAYLTLESTQVTHNRAGNGGGGGDGGEGGDALGTGSCENRIIGGAGGRSEGGLGGSGGWGGGIAVAGSTGQVTATDCDISGNVAGTGGAGGDAGLAAPGVEGPGVGGRGGNAFGGEGGPGGAGGGLGNAAGIGVPVRLTYCSIDGNATGAGGAGGAGGSGGIGGFSNGAESFAGVGGVALGGAAGDGGAGGAVALEGDATATVSDSTMAGNSTGAGGVGGHGGAGGAGGFSNREEASGGSAEGGSAGAGGRGSALSDERTEPAQDPLVIDEDTIEGNVGGDGGEGGHGGVSAALPQSTAGGRGGRAGGPAVGTADVPLELTHDTIDANAAGALGPGGPGGGPGSGAYTGPGAGGGASAGGVGTTGSPMTLTASIVYGDEGGECEAAHVIDGGEDLTDVGSSCPGATGDPWLEGLADNGGIAPTQALGGGSAAIGAVPFATGLCATLDERGVMPLVGRPCAIGAYQPVPPGASTGAATAVTATTATLGGTVIADAASASVRFDYGPSPAYGASVAAPPAGTGTVPTPVGAELAGLQPGTTYHYRLVATTRDGSTVGSDQTFTTAAAGAPGGGGQAGAGGDSGRHTAPFAGLTLRAQSVKLTKPGRARVKATCPATTVVHCTGTLRLTIAKRGVKARADSLGTVTFALPAGQKATLTVKLGRVGVRRVDRGRGGKLAATATARAIDGLGRSKTTSAKVTLHRYARPKRHRVPLGATPG
jgi:CSLREA domain-containing protein